MLDVQQILVAALDLPEIARAATLTSKTTLKFDFSFLRQQQKIDEDEREHMSSLVNIALG
jgi:hypothetical protein